MREMVNKKEEESLPQKPTERTSLQTPGNTKGTSSSTLSNRHGDQMPISCRSEAADRILVLRAVIEQRFPRDPFPLHVMDIQKGGGAA